MRHQLSFAAIGWLAGILSTVVLGLIWPIIFPAIINIENYYGSGPGLITIIGITLLLITPAALIGGLIGGRLSVEGGAGGQRLIAIILGVIFAAPCGCFGYWFFTGF